MNFKNFLRILIAVLFLSSPLYLMSCAESDDVEQSLDGDDPDDNNNDDNNDPDDNNDNSGNSGGDDNSSTDPNDDDTSDEDELPTPNNSYVVSSKSEFDAAVKAVQPGDEIVLAAGTYTDIEFEFDADGTEENMIYLRGEDPSKVFISGDSQIKFGGDYLYVYNLSFNGCVATSSSSKGTIVEFRNGSSNEAYHCTLSDCHFDACVPTDKSYDDVWVGMYGQYNTVQRCYFGDKDNKGLYIIVWHKNEKSDYHTIRKNYFYRPDTYNSEENGQEIIRIGDSSNSYTDSYTTVEDNFFYQCNGEVEIISIKSGKNLINRNTFLECKGCVTLRHGEESTISNNYFITNKVDRAGGVRIIDRGHIIYNNYFYGQQTDDERAAISIQEGVLDGELNEYDPVEDVIIAHNTLVDCKQNFSFGVSGSGTSVAPTGVSIIGTIVVTDQTSSLIDSNGIDTSGITFSYSHLEGTTGVSSGDGLVTSTYTESTMKIAGSTFPKLVATSTYKTNPDFITTDISGVARGTSTALGAIADADSAPASSVADNSNCGPNWSGWSKPL